MIFITRNVSSKRLLQRGRFYFKGKNLSRLWLFALVCLSLFTIDPAGSAEIQPPPVPAPYRQFWGDSFDSTSFQILGVGLAATLAAQPSDERMRDSWVNHQQMDAHTARIGDLLGTGIPGLLVGLAQYKWDRVNGEAHLKTWLAAGTWTHVLKVAVGRKRPGSSENRQSFPSGHTSIAFASATSLGYAYGWKVGVPLGILAAGVGASRMADDAHWFSDTVAGAAIGVWMGYAYRPFTNISQVGSPVNAVASMRSTRPFLLLPSFGNETFFLSVLSEY